MMININRKRIAFVICIAVLFNFPFTEKVFGGGFENNSIGSKAYSMACAFTGIADDASAVFYNPGGLVFLDKNTWYGDVYFNTSFTKFTYSGNSIKDKSEEVYFNPGFFISKTYENWAFGFGSYVPYAGGGTVYENFQGSPYDLESIAGFTAFTPAVSYKISPYFSIGAGVSLYYGMMENKYFNPDLTTEVKADYDGIAGYGGHIGLMLKPSKGLSLGLSIKSEVPIEMDGDMEISENKYESEVEFTLPYSFILGLGYKVNSNLLFGIDFGYIPWHDFGEITVKTQNSLKIAPTNYKNTWQIRMGFEYKLSEKFAVRGGNYFSQGATKDEGLDPRSNDVDVLLSSLGIAYNLSGYLEMTINGSYVCGFEKKYDGKTFDQDHFCVLVGFRFRYPGKE